MKAEDVGHAPYGSRGDMMVYLDREDRQDGPVVHALEAVLEEKLREQRLIESGDKVVLSCSFLHKSGRGSMFGIHNDPALIVVSSLENFQGMSDSGTFVFELGGKGTFLTRYEPM